MRKAWCSGCLTEQLVDHKWRAIWIDTDGDLIVSVPSKECNVDFERPGTVFACGEGCSLVITERYLSFNSLDVPQAIQQTLNLQKEIA
jgi:hypothetical protein